MKKLVLLSFIALASPIAAQTDTANSSFFGIFATCANMVYEGNGEEASDLFARCSEIVFAGDEDAALIAGRDELAVVGRHATESAVAQGANLAARMADVRAGVPNLSITNLDFQNRGDLPSGEAMLAQLTGARGSGASADAGGERWGLFLNGGGAFGDRKTGIEDVSFDFESLGITLGVDYRFSDSFFAGIAYGYSGGDSDLTGGGGVEGNGLGELEIDGHSLSLYGSASASENFFIDGSLTVGRTDYASSTKVSYQIHEVTLATDTSGNILFDENGKVIPVILPGMTTVNQLALSDTEGDLLAGSLAIGHNLVRGGFTLMSVLHGGYSKLEVEGYDERFSNPEGTGGQLNLRISEQELKSLLGSLEFTVSYAKSTSWGIFLPQLRAGWTHQFEDDARQITTGLLSDPNLENRETTPPVVGNPLPLEESLSKDMIVFTDEPDRNFGQVGLGFSAVFRNGHQAFLFWDTTVSRGDLSYNAFSAGIRFAI